MSDNLREGLAHLLELLSKDDGPMQTSGGEEYDRGLNTGLRTSRDVCVGYLKKLLLRAVPAQEPDLCRDGHRVERASGRCIDCGQHCDTFNRLAGSNSRKLNDAVQVLQQAKRDDLAQAVMRLEGECITQGRAVPPAAQPAPPKHVVDLAVEVSGWSPCRSKRGVVIFDSQSGNVISHGHNYKPRGFDCNGSEACKSTCRAEAVHAEQQALINAGGRPKTDGAELLHVKTVDGNAVASDGPSCIQCSTLALACGIAGVWLLHESGWRRYDAAEFHRLSLAAREAPVTPPASKERTRQ